MAPATCSASNLADVSDQTFLVQVFGPGEVVPAFQGVRRRLGGHGGNGQHRLQLIHRKDLSFAFGTAVPFGLNARQMNAWLTYGGSLDLLNDLYKTYNSTACRSAIRPRRWGWLRKEVKNRR